MCKRFRASITALLLPSPILFCVERVCFSPLLRELQLFLLSSLSQLFFFTILWKLCKKYSLNTQSPAPSYIWKRNLCNNISRRAVDLGVFVQRQRPNACFIDPRINWQKKRHTRRARHNAAQAEFSEENCELFSLLCSYFQDHEIWFCNRKGGEKVKSFFFAKCTRNISYPLFFAHFELVDFSPPTRFTSFSFVIGKLLNFPFL